MSAIILANGSTTLVLNGEIIGDLQEGENLMITSVNPATTQTNGIDGAVNINERSDKDVHDVTIRVIKFSDSDVFLNTARNQTPPTLFQGSAKESYNKDGNDAVESYSLENGSFTAQPSKSVNSLDGSPGMEYVIRFRRATRNL